MVLISLSILIQFLTVSRFFCDLEISSFWPPILIHQLRASKASSAANKDGVLINQLDILKSKIESRILNDL